MKEGWLLTHVLRFVDSEWPFRLLGRVSQVQAMRPLLHAVLVSRETVPSHAIFTSNVTCMQRRFGSSPRPSLLRLAPVSLTLFASSTQATLY
jgi:hypothetical protein